MRRFVAPLPPIWAGYAAAPRQVGLPPAPLASGALFLSLSLILL
jgi:hypothetical protein